MGAIRSLRFSSDGRFLAAAEPADFVHVYDVGAALHKAQVRGVIVVVMMMCCTICGRIYDNCDNYPPNNLHIIRWWICLGKYLV